VEEIKLQRSGMLGPLANRHWFAIKLAPALPSWLVADLLLIQRFENVSLIVSDLKSPQKLNNVPRQHVAPDGACGALRIVSIHMSLLTDLV
jgi:hypothetical protein